MVPLENNLVLTEKKKKKTQITPNLTYKVLCSFTLSVATVLQLFLQRQFYRTVNLESLSRSKADVQYWLALTKRADLVGIAITYR